MKFHERITAIENAIHLGLMPRKYQAIDLNMLIQGWPRVMGNQLKDEHNWISDKKPYYNLWPGIVEPLRRTRLDVPGDSVHLPRSPILLRFAEGHELAEGDVKCRSVIASEVEVVEENKEETRGICLWCDFGEYEQIGSEQFMIGTYRVFRLSGMTVQEGMDISNRRFDPISPVEEKLLDEVCKIVIAVALMNEDEDFFSPDILGKDRGIYSSTNDPARKQVIEERARRRGKIGWDVGKELHDTPHVVPPYFAIRWMNAQKGKPGAKPVLRPISGYVTHKKLITNVPTGYLSSQENQE